MPKVASLESSDFFLHLPAQMEFLHAIGQFAHAAFSSIPALKGKYQDVYNLELVVSEACTNVIRHAYPEQEPGPLDLSISATDTEIHITIMDNGKGFDPYTVPEPDFDSLPEGGMGIFIIRSNVDSFDYRHEEGTNILELAKKLPC